MYDKCLESLYVKNPQKKRKEAAASMNNLKLVPSVTSGGGGGYSTGGAGVGVNGAAGVPGPLSGAAGAAAAANATILRKTASESNLLKMKMKKKMGAKEVGPYQRAGPGGNANPNLHAAGREPSIPETQAVSIVNNSANSDSLQGSPCSNHSTSSFGSAAAAPQTNTSIGTYVMSSKDTFVLAFYLLTSHYISPRFFAFNKNVRLSLEL